MSRCRPSVSPLDVNDELLPCSDLSGFLDAHLTYIEQYRDILLEVKKDWQAP